MALVCDQGTTFQTCLKSFQLDTKREQILNGEPEGKYYYFFIWLIMAKFIFLLIKNILLFEENTTV